MALMGSDQARMGQDDQARAVLEWLSSEGAQNLLRQVSADRAQRADQPDIQRGQEEQQRRRDEAVHDWLNTPEAQRFLMGREDADIALRQQGQRGPGAGAGPQPQHPGSMGFTPQPPFQGGPFPGQMQTDRQQMMEGLMAAGPGNPDFDRGPYTPGAFEQRPRGQFAPPPPQPRHPGSFGPPQQAPMPPRRPPGMMQLKPQYY
tara:strand:+ start:13174 stop:13782 length:609 start_codon:yes stop_codon:yes gene_type:complete